MNFRMNVLSIDDIQDCTTLYLRVFNEEPWNDGWDEEDALARLTEIFGHQKFVGIGMYDEEQSIVAFLLGYTERWLNNNHFYLNEMCVRPDLQNMGLGSQLISQLEQTCIENAIERIYLLTARDGQAEAFYKKNGYYTSPKMIMMAKILER